MIPDPTVSALTPEIERRNGLIFIWTQLLIYFSAPVLYVGVVQAAFLDKLGASATVANLPSSTYMLGAVFFLMDDRLRYSHLVWHLFVLAGSGCHFAALLLLH